MTARIIPLHRVEAPCDVEPAEYLQRGQPSPIQEFAKRLGDAFQARAATPSGLSRFASSRQHRIAIAARWFINGDGFYILAGALLAADFGFALELFR